MKTSLLLARGNVNNPAALPFQKELASGSGAAHARPHNLQESRRHRLLHDPQIEPLDVGFEL
jgi:hypothetical protein